MLTQFIETNIKYDGSQLRSLYAYLDHGLLGDSIVAWIGACDVDFEHMVDGEDLLQKASIKADKMLHFIIEAFDIKLFSAVCLQRLFAEMFISYIDKNSTQTNISKEIIRCGDDIYYRKKKFNISIATVSPSSALIHFAVNIDGQGAPVETLSLADLKLDPEKTAKELMSQFVAEYKHIKRATRKVKWVK